MYQVTLIKDIFAVVIHPEGGFTDPRRSECTVFVCGSLMDPAFTAGVVGRAVSLAPALAEGFSRGYAEVGGKPMHFMRRDPDATLPGMAILGLTEDELAKLEAFEQCPAVRQKVELELRIGDVVVVGRTYLQIENK